MFVLSLGVREERTQDSNTTSPASRVQASFTSAAIFPCSQRLLPTTVPESLVSAISGQLRTKNIKWEILDMTNYVSSSVLS